MSVNQQSTNLYFTIEGNIGCGKSTILEILETHFPSIKFLEEPVEEWRNVGNTGNNILHSYYQDTSRWGLSFLQYALFTRLMTYHNLRETHRQAIIISERSPLSDKYVFFELMKDLGILNPTQIALFQQFYKGQETMLKLKPPRIIYLRSTPVICKERTTQRQRAEEADIPIEYFERLHEKHEEWMKREPKQNVLVIDTTKEFKSDSERVKEIVRDMTEFIGKSQQ